MDCDIEHKLKGGHGGRRNEPGIQIKKFTASWQKAAKEAGNPDLLFHDLRTSAVGNMVEKMGWSEKKAMIISGPERVRPLSLAVSRFVWGGLVGKTCQRPFLLWLRRKIRVQGRERSGATHIGLERS